MAHAYSIDLRECAVDFVECGGSFEAASEMFGPCTKTISEWFHKKREIGHLHSEKTGCKGTRKIDYGDLRNYVEENNDRTLEEIGKVFSVTASSVHKALKKLGVTYKKKQRSTPSGMKKNAPST
jgi:transposase